MENGKKAGLWKSKRGRRFGHFLITLLLAGLALFAIKLLRSVGNETISFGAFILAVALPSILHGVIHRFFHHVDFEAIFVDLLLGAVLLVVVFPIKMVFGYLGFSLVFFLVCMMVSKNNDLKKKNRKKALSSLKAASIYESEKVEVREGGLEDGEADEEEEKARRTGRRNLSKVHQSSWANSFYSWFRKR